MAAPPKAPNTSLPPIAEAAPVEVSAGASEVSAGASEVSAGPSEVCDASFPPLVDDGAEEPVEAAAEEDAAPPKRVALIPVAFLQSDGMDGALPVTKFTGAH